jgi:hypothetical protein
MAALAGDLEMGEWVEERQMRIPCWACCLALVLPSGAVFCSATREASVAFGNLATSDSLLVQDVGHSEMGNISGCLQGEGKREVHGLWGVSRCSSCTFHPVRICCTC